MSTAAPAYHLPPAAQFGIHPQAQQQMPPPPPWASYMQEHAGHTFSSAQGPIPQLPTSITLPALACAASLEYFRSRHVQYSEGSAAAAAAAAAADADADADATAAAAPAAAPAAAATDATDADALTSAVSLCLYWCPQPPPGASLVPECPRPYSSPRNRAGNAALYKKRRRSRQKQKTRNRTAEPRYAKKNEENKTRH